MLCAVNTAIFVAVLQQNIGVDNVRLASAALAIVSAFTMGCMSYFEHMRAPRTSLLLNAYSLVSLILGIARTRTMWLVFGHQAHTVLFTTSIGLTAVIAVLEAIPKKHWKTHPSDNLSPEETSGLYSLAFFTWLIPIIRLGNYKILDTEDLYPIDSKLAADVVSEQFQRTWRTTRSPPDKGLLFALLKSLLWSFLGPIPSRLAMVGFAFCQPFFIRALINYLESGPGHNHVTGSSLALTSVFIYVGIALSTSSFYYLNQRANTKVRSALGTAVFQKTVELSSTHLDTSVLTLMSTDIDRIQRGLQPIHDLWALTLQVILAAWLLHRQLGPAFLAPIGLVFVCALGSLAVSGFLGPRITQWTRCTERRVKMTNAVVASMKSVKISGLADPIGAFLQKFREIELRAGISLRLVTLVAIANAFAPTYLSPVVTFAAAGRKLGMAEMFASLSYLLLLTGPLNQLFQKIPMIVTGLSCMKRIQDFLGKESSVDYRHFEEAAFVGSDVDGQEVAISLQNVKVGWIVGKWQLSDLNLAIQKSELTIITGPVASGKSTLCKALLGEVSFTEGSIKFHQPRPRIGYCDQTPFLINGSVRSNIVGFGSFDGTLYDEILETVMLKSDLRTLPRADSTEIGSGGVTLSGGQKQRVALARALYLDTDVYVLDDFTVGLDQPTADEIVRRLFGPDGFLRRRKATVVWCTHNIHFLSLAQHVISLGSDGRVTHQGAPDEVLNDRQVILALGPENDNGASIAAEKKDPATQDSPGTKLATGKRESRALNGTEVYAHYFSSFGPVLIVSSILIGLSYGFLANFGVIWLKFWADNSFHIPGSESHVNSFYLRTLAVISVAILVAMVSFIGIVMLGMATVSGSVLHLRAVQALMGAPLRYLTKTDQGVIVNYFSQDMNLLDLALPGALMNAFALGAAALGQAVVVVVGTPFIACAYPVLIIVLYVLTARYLRTSRQLRLLEMENKSPLYAQFADTVRGITSIRAFGWLAEYTAQNHLFLDDSQRPLYLLAMTSLWLGLVLKLIVAGLAVAVTILATQLVAHTDGAGFVGAGFVALMEFGDLLNAFIQCWVEFEMSLGAVKRLKDFGDTAGSENKVGEDLRPQETWPEKGEIVIDGVTASYEEEKYKDDGEDMTMALHGVSMKISAGEKAAIVGRTGSGKSSLILLLLRLLDPTTETENNTTIDGLPLHRIHRDTLRRRIIAMPQDMVFLAAGETFKNALDPQSQATDEECHAALEQVGLLDAVMEAGGLLAEIGKDTLSQGQKQLFSLAIAVLRAQFRQQRGAEGGVLLLDEVTSNVDRETEKIIMGVIRQVFKNYTVLAVTHSLESVEGFDKVFVMADGRVVQEGTPRSLIKAQKGTD